MRKWGQSGAGIVRFDEIARVKLGQKQGQGWPLWFFYARLHLNGRYQPAIVSFT